MCCDTRTRAESRANSTDVIKIGRTHLQDAVPMRLGQEFGGYAQQVRMRACADLDARSTDSMNFRWAAPLWARVLNAPGGFRGRNHRGDRARDRPAVRRSATNHFEAQAVERRCGVSQRRSAGYAVALTKIANDIRWLGSGPRCGLGELKLPAVQPGSSIMPGKVNPVIAESLLMVCAQVIGYDATIAWCGGGGQFRAECDDAGDGLRFAGCIGLLACGFAEFCRPAG